jgi:precorrin-6B methylase 2
VDAEPGRAPDILFVGTPTEVVDRMLRLAEFRRGDVLYDLGCGDGRIVVAAARRYGVRAVGIEIDPKLVLRARENARRNGVAHLVEIRQVDLFEANLGDATVVTMYLLPRLNAALEPKLARLRPGARVLSHSFPMGDATPESVTTVPCADGIERRIYRWVVPWGRSAR